MSTEKLCIVSDIDNLHFWKASVHQIRTKYDHVHIFSDKDFNLKGLDRPYDDIVVDISDIKELYRLIPRIHRDQPQSRIFAVSYTPTWRQTREVIKLGATYMIRKSHNLDEVIGEVTKIKPSMANETGQCSLK